MFDYKNITSVKYQFKPDEEIDNRINAFDGANVVGYVDLKGGTFEASSDEIFLEYKLYQSRPEYSLGKIVEIEDRNIEQLLTDYEELLVGAYLANRPETIIKGDGSEGFCKMLDWLRTTDFYTCPASTRYHEAYHGGLLVHSLRVYNAAVTLHRNSIFHDKVDMKSLALAALTHDWCKIGLYESYVRNVKNEKTGKWEPVTAYRRHQTGIPLGHGATSMFLASKFFRLSVEEALAIRWHQGRWNVCEAEFDEFQMSNEKFPLVHLLQFADQLAITEYF